MNYQRKSKQILTTVLLGTLFSTVIILNLQLFIDLQAFFLVLVICFQFYFLLRKQTENFFYLSIIVAPIYGFSIPGFLSIYGIFLIFILLLLLRHIDVKNNYFLLFLLIIIASTINTYLRFNFDYYFLGVFTISGWLMIIIIMNKAKIGPSFFNNVLYLPIVFAPIVFYEIIFRPFWGGRFEGGWRIYGISGQPNVFALTINPFVIASFSLFLYKKKKIHLTLTVLYSIFVLFTFSRMGIVSLIVGLIIVLLFKDFKISSKTFLQVSAIIFAVSIAMLFIQISNDRLENISYDAVTIERAYIWEDVWYTIRYEIIFGLGLGATEYVKSFVMYNLSTHNIYLAYLTNIGVIGLVTIIITWLHIVKKLFYNITDNFYTLQQKHIMRSSIGMMFMLFFNGLTSASATSLVNSVTIWIFVGYSLSILSSNNKKNL